MKNFLNIQMICGGLLALCITACNTEKEQAEQAEREKAAAEAHREALGIRLYCMTWTVTQVTEVPATEEDAGRRPNDFKTILRLEPNEPYSKPFTCEFWSSQDDLGGYEILWKELGAGSEVEFDFHDNKGATEVMAYLIPRITSDSPRWVQ